MRHRFFLAGCACETGQNIDGRSFAFGSISRNGVLRKFPIVEGAHLAWWLFVGHMKHLLERSTCIVMCWRPLIEVESTVLRLEQIRSSMSYRGILEFRLGKWTVEAPAHADLFS